MTLRTRRRGDDQNLVVALISLITITIATQAIDETGAATTPTQSPSVPPVGPNSKNDARKWDTMQGAIIIKFGKTQI